MSITKKPRSSRYLSTAIGVVVLVAMAIFGCGDSSSSSSSEEPIPVGRGRWALHVHVGPEKRRVDFVPDAVANDSRTSAPFKRSLKAAAIANEGSMVPASKLLLGAAGTCGLASSEIAPDVWPENGWFVFSQKPTTCDAALRYEQVTMCMADKLAELADAVNVVQWDNIPQSTGLPGPWVILPQSDLDRFISRDLAIYTLGNLAQLNTTSLDSNRLYTCSQMYSKARIAADTLLTNLFDADSAGKIGLKVASGPLDPKLHDVLDDRLKLQTMTLRSATHLLRDLIKENIEADMAGAAHRAGQASDPSEANKAIWGEGDPYNSLAHAMRVLAGRWQSAANPSKEPTCGSAAEPITSMSLLKTLGDEVKIREQDFPIATQAQSDAATLISRAGVLVDPTLLAQGQDLREVIREQLITIAANQAGRIENPSGNWSVPSEFKTGPEAIRASKLLDDLSDADLRFGLDYVARSFQLTVRTTNIPKFTQGGAVLSDGTTMTHFAYVTPALRGLGTVVTGGLGRESLPKDVSGRVYGAIAAACPSAPPPWKRDTFSDPGKENATVLQDSFAIAHTLSVGMRDIYLSLDDRLPPTYQPSTTISQTIAEMRPWAGLGSIEVTEVPDPRRFVITLLGVTAAELGVATLSQETVASTLALADDGECAAHLRPDCPSVPVTGLDPSQVDVYQGPFGATIFITVNAPDPQARLPRWLFSRRGYADHGMLIAPLYGTHLAAPLRQELTNSLFAFPSERLHNPRVGDRGAARSDAYCIDGVPRDLFVPLENELTSQGNDASEESWKHYLAVAKEAAERADGLGEKLVQIGMEQDTRRERAAAELAQACGDISALDQLKINSNGTIDAKGASESLQKCMQEPQCDVVFLSQFTVSANQVENRTRLRSLLHCDQDSSGDVCTRLREHPNIEVVTCDKNTAASSDPQKSQKYITVGSLHLIRSETEGRPEVSCNTVMQPKGAGATGPGVIQSLRGVDLGVGLSTAAVGAMVRQRWATEGELRAAAYGLQMVVSPISIAEKGLRDGQWRLVAGASLMESDTSTMDPKPTADDPPLWPSCLRANAADCRWDTNPRARLFNTLFRSRCPNGSQDSCKLGEAEGGDPMAEVNILRWRVQGSLWMLGMLSGGVVGSTFKTPLPAVDFSKAVISAPLSAIYGHSYFGNDGYLRTDGPDNIRSTGDDARLLGETMAVNSSAFTVWGKSFNKLPSWYGSIFGAQKDNYRLILGVDNDDERYKDDDDAAVEAGWIIRPKHIQDIASEAAAMRCPDFDGAPTGGGGQGVQDRIIERLALIKGAWSQEDRVATVGAYQGAWFSPANRGAHFVESQGLMSRYYVGFDPNSGLYQALVNPWYQGQRKDRPIDVTCADPIYDDCGFGENDGPWCNGLGARGNIVCTAFFNHGHYATPGDQGDHLTTEAEAMPPRRRAKAFLNAGPAADACSALSELTGAYGLACSVGELDASGIVPATLPDPPRIDSPNAIPRFQRWLSQLEARVRQRASGDYAQAIPYRAVQDFAQKQTATGSLKGAHGDAIIEIENGLAAISVDWMTIEKALHDLNEDIGHTQAIVRGVNRETELRIKALEFRMARAIIAGAASIIGGIVDVVTVKEAGRGVSNIINGAAGGVLDVMSINQDIEIERARNDNEVLQQLIRLSVSSRDTQHALATTLAALISDTNKVSSAASRLRTQQNLSAYHAAQGLGADYVVTSEGTATPIPLNTVLRRQFAGNRIRYDRALRTAKSMAYMARRSIEQRLGVSLSDLHESIGPLEAPATWADSVCHLTGIDYSKLRELGKTMADGGTVLEPALGDGGFDRAQIDAYADAYVGDYVARLASFIDHYNVQYPSHEADDTAILSLREDFLPRPEACVLPAPNLLYYSSQLDVQAIGTLAAGGKPGWEYTPCVSGQKCLMARAAQGYPDSVAPVGAVRSHVTILEDRAFPPPPEQDPFEPPRTDSRPGRVVNVPHPGYVTQSVVLEADEQYVLSWWDQARVAGTGQDGGTSAADPRPYRVVVFWENPADKKWEQVEGQVASASFLPGTWSERKSLRFKARAGVHHVAFAASEEDKVVLGAVAIAGVQLEKGFVQSSYVETTARRENYSAYCPVPDPDVLRASFERICDDATATCYYEFKDPIVIDEMALQRGQTMLSTKIARGGYNYRHTDIALNLAGQNVHSCQPDDPSNPPPVPPPPSCSARGFIEYGLYHDAQDVPILDWNGTPHYFDFGLGQVAHGKALAKGANIRMPIDAADLAMLQQPGIQRIEYRGRPLDGRYRLRIYDEPALKFQNLTDVQFVLRHRSWSKVGRPSRAN